MRAPVVPLLLALAALWPGSAFARRPARLVYELDRDAIAAACVDERGLKKLIVARLGYDPLAADATLEIRASITRSGERLRGRVEIDAGGVVEGVRVIESTKGDCAELASTMALTISIAIDPLVLTRKPAATPEPEGGEVAQDTVPVAAPPERSVSPPPPPPARSATPNTPNTPSVARDRVGLRTAVSLGASVGTAPSVTAGVGASVGAAYRRASLDLEGRFDTTGSAQGRSGRVSSRLVLATLAPCVHFGVGVACALVAAGRLQAQGAGVDTPREQAGFYAAAGARVGVEIPLSGPLSIGVRADVLVPLQSVRLDLDRETVWEAPPVTGATAVALIAKFP